ncbi:MAG TPA: SLC13 family permease, partial [Candidatus Gastranaerophilaceae bacterium]|nr:SLC13 family permease [Candidatus Gastranaerophilaceae bacterium]
MEFIQNFVHANSILVSVAILLLAYFFIATEKVPKVTIALAGATIAILLGPLSQEKGMQGELNPAYFINYIDFNVIFLLVSMMLIVNIAARSGMFNWFATELLRLTKGHPKSVLFVLGVFTAIASAFLDNVTTVILVMPVTFVVARELDITPVPFLITEILTSNIGGTATLIGDPPNIIIGSAAGLSFLDFLLELTDIVLIILLISLAILVFMFRKVLKSSPEKMEHIAKLDNSGTIKDYNLMIRSSIVLFLVVLGFVLHDVIHVQSCIVAMAGASFLLMFEKPHQILHDVEWNTIFFFIGLFIIIGGVEASGGISLMAQWLLDITNGSQKVAAMVILWASGILSGIIDNIPYTVTMAPMLLEVQKAMGEAYIHPLWWCLSLGA